MQRVEYVCRHIILCRQTKNPQHSHAYLVICIRTRNICTTKLQAGIYTVRYLPKYHHVCTLCIYMYMYIPNYAIIIIDQPQPIAPTHNAYMT